jgi:hypothetical protein
VVTLFTRVGPADIWTGKPVRGGTIDRNERAKTPFPAVSRLSFLSIGTLFRGVANEVW